MAGILIGAALVAGLTTASVTSTPEAVGETERIGQVTLGHAMKLEFQVDIAGELYDVELEQHGQVAFSALPDLGGPGWERVRATSSASTSFSVVSIEASTAGQPTGAYARVLRSTVYPLPAPTPILEALSPFEPDAVNPSQCSVSAYALDCAFGADAIVWESSVPFPAVPDVQTFLAGAQQSKLRSAVITLTVGDSSCDIWVHAPRGQESLAVGSEPGEPAEAMIAGNGCVVPDPGAAAVELTATAEILPAESVP